MWFMESNRYFCKIENFAYGEINERSFSNPHPRTKALISKCIHVEYKSDCLAGILVFRQIILISREVGGRLWGCVVPEAEILAVW